ncbi:unnamed protein product [Ectocarpus fasciculatus]
MNALLLVLAVTHQQYAAAFMVRPQAAPSLASGEPATCTSTSSLGGGLHVATDVSTRPRAAYTRLRSRQDVAPSGTSGDGDYSREEEQPEDAADVDVERLMSSLESSDLFGGGGATGGEGEGGGGGRGGLAAAASKAVADIEDPGKLVLEAAKPFRDEMDRIQAEFQRNVAEKEEEMDKKLDDMLKNIDGKK